MLAGALLAGCSGEKEPPAEKAAAAKSAEKPATTDGKSEKAPGEAAKAPGGEVMSKEEVVFDPRNPPPGFTLCHRNHCHRVGGGVASYTQVMAEIGAEKMVGAPQRAAMPEAPADVAAPPADAEVTPSGLATRVLEAGDGKRKPTADSVVIAHYTGWTTDGKAFDSSVSRGRPATFPLNRVIPGWTEGLQLMSVGETRRFWIPEDLAYRGRPGRPAGMLVFDVELLGIK